MSDRVFNTLAVISLLFALVCACVMPALTDNPETAETQTRAFKGQIKVLYLTYTPYDATPVIEYKANRDAAGATLDSLGGLFETIDSVEFPKKQMVLTSLGKYYITGYTSIECGGSTMTASGATVYYAPDELRLTNPTTCAIDPVIHDFGDLFYIEEFDRVYIAQDTGSAVKQKHLDLYLPDDMYNYALSITGYYTVYSVEYVDTTYRPADYDIREAVAATVLGSYFTTD